VADGQVEEDGQALVSTPLVLDRAADGHVRISFAPVFGQGLQDAFRPLGDNVEKQVTPSTYHQPCIRAPLIGLLDKEVGGEARPHQCARRHLELSLSALAYGQVEGGRLADFVRVLVKFRIAPKHVAVLAALALLMASVPQIPHLAHGSIIWNCCRFNLLAKLDIFCLNRKIICHSFLFLWYFRLQK